MREGLKECGSLNASRKAWALILEALGVNVFRYLWRNGEPLLSLDEAAKALVAEAVPAASEDAFPAVVSIDAAKNLVEFFTPNGVMIHGVTEDGSGTVIVFVDFNRDSSFLATMMLAGFLRRVPEAYKLLAEAATELAATCK